MLGWVWLKKMDNLSYISRVLFEIVLCFLSFFVGQLGRTSTPFFVIESNKMMCFSSSKPMIDGNTINREDRHQCSRIYALATQQKTMGTLPHTMMLTLFRHSLEQAESFGAHILNKSPL